MTPDQNDLSHSDPTPKPRGIVLLGPTAGGKSDLAAALAQHADGEVIGADSMQVYRYLDAGTAKPPHELREKVPHHLVDIVEPTERFSVHDWLKLAEAQVDRIQTRGGLPVVVGGTNLYLKALLEGLFDGPGQDEAFRASLAEIETHILHERLCAIDPETANHVKPADRHRIVRALEVHKITGQPISAMQTQWRDGRWTIGDSASNSGDALSTDQHPPFRLLGLRWSPETINPRINLRVKAMFYPKKVDAKLAQEVCINGESLIEEVNRLKDEGKFGQQSSFPNQAREALGYKQLLALIEKTDSKIKTIEDAYERTKILTRRFAKQQRTWLKRFTHVHWIDCNDADTKRITDEAFAWLNTINE